MLPKTRTEKEKNYLKKIYTIYGTPKSGKTTVASQFGDDLHNKVLFFATEPGHKFQEIYKFQNVDGSEPTKWHDFLDCCRELVAEEHDFKMLAVDTVDNLWDWCADYIKNKHSIEHESDLGFGKGYALIREEFMKPIKYLGQIGMGLLFISHEKTMEREIGPRKVTFTDTTMPNSAKKVILGLSDYIFYFYQDTEGKRLIRSKGNENFNAGDRSGKLPELMPMDHRVLIEELSK